MHRKAKTVIGVVLLGAGLGLAQSQSVAVEFADAGSSDVRLLVDGGDAAGEINDRVVQAPDGVATLGDLRAGVRNEIIAFTDRRPPTVFPIPDWTQVASPLAFDPEVVVQLHVWVARGPFLDVKSEAIRHVATARAIFREERLGLRLGTTTYHDATAVPAALLDFECGRQAELVAAAGNTDGAINVYYVETVEGRYGFGHRCTAGSGFAVIAAVAGDGLLAHELGHNLGLEHIDYLTSAFDPSNVMHSASDEREYLTEGQSFRATYHPQSALNDHYAVRQGQDRRFCDTEANSEAEALACPPIALRLWADGARLPQ